MESKVNLREKKLHPQRQGKPKKYNAFKMIKVRPETYFRLVDLKDDLALNFRRQYIRPTINKTIAFLLDFYNEQKAKAKKGNGEEL